MLMTLPSTELGTECFRQRKQREEGPGLLENKVFEDRGLYKDSVSLE